MKTIALITIALVYLTINCNHNPKCETWQEHKIKVIKLPGNGK